MKFKLDYGDDDRDFIICDVCKYIIIPRYTCEAFPQGIPEEILKGKNNHSKILTEQQNDIVFGFKNLIMPLM